MKQAFEQRAPDWLLHIYHTTRGPKYVEVELHPIFQRKIRSGRICRAACDCAQDGG